MSNHLVINCPDCRAPATFKTPNWLHATDALMLVDIDGLACRRCGARLVPLKECCRG